MRPGKMKEQRRQFQVSFPRSRLQESPLREMQRAKVSSWIPLAASLPSEPCPQPRIEPHDRPPEQHETRGAPADPNFSVAFHARSNRAILIQHENPREEDSRFPL